MYRCIYRRGPFFVDIVMDVGNWNGMFCLSLATARAMKNETREIYVERVGINMYYGGGGWDIVYFNQFN